jgi:hypothetical protein
VGQFEIELTMEDLRAVARYAAEAAEEVLDLFEKVHTDDHRPREAVENAWAFGRGGKRNKALRVTSLAALQAAGEAQTGPATHAAWAAVLAASAAYLHPLAKATQVKHILGSAAHAAHALELDAGGDTGVGDGHIDRAARRASADLISVLSRYPAAPHGGGRVGELIRRLDSALRQRS